MALATQCPHCHTTFRVAHDQLKLRAGLVRCGACKQIFNGIENLLRPEELEQATGRIAPPPPQPAPPEPAPVPPPAETKLTPSVDFDLGDLGDLEPEPAKKTPPASTFPDSSDTTLAEADKEEFGETPVDAEPRKDDPLLRMTLMDFAHERREPVIEENPQPDGPPAEESDAIEQAIDDLESKPWRREQNDATEAEGDALDQAEAAEYEEPSFVKQGRRKQRIGRALRVFMAAASVFLLIGLLAQGAYVFRDQLAAWFPAAKPVLANACARLGCQVGLPAQIDAVSIESSELQTLAPESNTFALTVLLRNHGTTAQAWPNIELTLNDNNEKPIARRVFQPREYLADSVDAGKGFTARSEQAVKVHFELAQLKASGYRVYLFYP
ncbi:DUF3426 domain-containing protein [Noviherbaspirillum denitrificans]|uniref:Zinc finger/thioredoxin putative domain-containing protein n=1 Tax=Noviherbaspirillum denitrificans TaxID=1968433 RepID=A0A254T8S5_9BURK|nr:DUF3426 domain-containing protein [Noviherbaspirillum denitrificans]OWW19044.1 hypothetical protein AYR66_05590 [Noviherbaspirillum denitrificans]